MISVVYRFINKDDEIIYVGSAEDLYKRLRQHFEHGHLPEECYNNVLYVEYAEFKTRTEAYMYEQYEITKQQPYYNTNGKLQESLDLEYFSLVKEPVWKKIYADSNYGYKYNKVYTNFSEKSFGHKEPNRKYVLEEAKVIKRMCNELKQNKELFKDIDIWKRKCPTYLSLIDTHDLCVLSDCLPTESVHISYIDSICPERYSDTDYDAICIDKSFCKNIDQLKNLPIHDFCGVFECVYDGKFEFPYCKRSDIAFFVPAFNEKTLYNIEEKAKVLAENMNLVRKSNLLENISKVYREETKRYFFK